jgi:hypothetical protein
VPCQPPFVFWIAAPHGVESYRAAIGYADFHNYKTHTNIKKIIYLFVFYRLIYSEPPNQNNEIS